PDDAAGQGDRPPGTQDGGARRALVVAADPQRQVDAEVDAVGVAQFDLRVIADWAEDADVGDDALPRPDDRDQLLGSELALLVQIFKLGELGARAEKYFQIGGRHVHVPGGNVHHQRVRG